MPFPDNWSGRRADAALGSPSTDARNEMVNLAAETMIAHDLALAERIKRFAELMRAELTGSDFMAASPLYGHDMDAILDTLADWSMIDHNFRHDFIDHARDLAREKCRG